MKMVRMSGNAPEPGPDSLSPRCERRLVGRLGIAPSSRRVRAGTSLSKFATLMAIRKDREREGGVEPPQTGL